MGLFVERDMVRVSSGDELGKMGEDMSGIAYQADST